MQNHLQHETSDDDDDEERHHARKVTETADTRSPAAPSACFGFLAVRNNSTDKEIVLCDTQTAASS